MVLEATAVDDLLLELFVDEDVFDLLEDVLLLVLPEFCLSGLQSLPLSLTVS